MSTRTVGSRVQRREDPRLVRGDGRYLDDLGHEALAASFVRSPHANAGIVDIDVTGAIDVDGVVAVWTWEDLQETGTAADPLVLNGVSLVMSGTPAKDDRFLLQPTAGVAGAADPVTSMVAPTRSLPVPSIGPIRCRARAPAI